MSHQVTIQPSQHTFEVGPEQNILQAALAAGYVIPYGCRNGACGTCKGKIVTGKVDYGRHQEATLTPEEKASGLALFCQAKPLSDVVIECREINAIKDIQIRTLPCRVQKIERPASDVVILYLKLPNNERLQFLAGQYIDILLKDNKRRSFSMANPPHDDEFVQLHIRGLPGGQFSDFVFNKLKERDILRFNGPLGTFFLREDPKPIIFVASGTGFAPIKAIIEDVFHKDINRSMTLYWGGRREQDLYLSNLAKQWQQQHSDFTYVPVVSDALPEDRWQGRTGFVHKAVMEDFQDLSGYQVYACGAPVVVEAAHRDFTSQRGLSKDDFFSDSFTFAADPETTKLR